MRKRAVAGTGASIGAALIAAPGAQAADFTVTNLNDSGGGSLRQAILDANAAPTSDRVLFQSTLSGQITLGSELPITGATEVLGPGAGQLTISGNNNVRIFNVDLQPAPDTPVTISGLKLTGGAITTGVEAGGAVASKYADLTVSNTVISQNRSSGLGGGIANIGGAVTIRSSTISGNSAESSGGGIFHEANGSLRGLTIESSTITGNSSGNRGGGAVFSGGATAPFTIQSSTVSANSAANATYGGGGLAIDTFGSRTMVNTVVADNIAATAPDIRTYQPLDASFSLIENPQGATIAGGPNITGQDPKLAPLADNGGPTPTQALNVGSPAIDQGQASGVDQRGAPRPFDLAGVALAGDNDADIGAYERVTCGNVLVNEIGTAGNDVVTGTSGPDGILGQGGNDSLKGLGGKDGLCGGAGKDTLKGGAGNDKLLGEGGKDKLKGGKGNDVLKGGPANDSLVGGGGKDKLKGGKGKDKQVQ